jgi:lysophospholipase L1-like esterase
MQLIKKRWLFIAALGMSMLSVHAESLSSAPQCIRPDLAFSKNNHSGASFTWNTPTRAPDPPPVTPRAIALWGDSLTSAPDFIEAALSASGIATATVLPSFIQAGMTVPGLRLPLKLGCASKGWQVAYAHKEKRDQAGFSKGLLSLSSENPGDTISLDFRFPLPSTRVTQLTLLYEKPKPDGSLMLAVAVDDGDENFISLSKTSGSALQIRPDTPMAAIRIRLVSGKVTVHGFAPSYQAAPAALLDSFSIPGGLLRSWSNTRERLFPAASAMAADYSVILVQYGTNEGANPGFSRDNYVSYLRANLGRLRKFYPRSRCILIGPPDRGVVGSVAPPGALHYSNVHHQIALAQKQVGLEQRCAFWDWQAAMGGPGSAARWARMNPPQMQADLTHLTARGYQVSGRMFAAALPLNKN